MSHFHIHIDEWIGETDSIKTLLPQKGVERGNITHAVFEESRGLYGTERRKSDGKNMTVAEMYECMK